MKHGVRLHLVNLYADPLGNPTLPKKFGSGQIRRDSAEQRRIDRRARARRAPRGRGDCYFTLAPGRAEERRHSGKVDRGAADG